MKSKMKLMPLLVSVTLISGCTVLPGSNMSTMGKDVIKQQDADFDLDKMVNVYPLYPVAGVAGAAVLTGWRGEFG